MCFWPNNRLNFKRGRCFFCVYLVPNKDVVQMVSTVFFVSGPQISILSWWLLSLRFWTKYWISYGFYVAALLIPKCSMSKRFRKCVLPMPKKTPWPNCSQLLVVCSDQTKASCSKCFLRFLVFLIQRKRNAQMVSVLPLCVSDPERDCCANGIFLTVFDPKHFACPQAFCILCFWKNTLFSNGFCFVELLTPINIIRTISQMRVFLTKGFTLKWSQLIKKKLHA